MTLATKLINYLKDSRTELKKVIWPDRKTTTNHTIMVIAFSIGVSLFLATLDYIFTYAYNSLVK